MSRAPGRPRLASRELLQEAAFELFQLRGYRGTSVEQIAKTAGFSRATFFNFFSSKAELFWVETDGLIQSLGAHLVGALDREHPPALRDALLEYAAGMRSADIPWALQHVHLLEAADDLVASGASRVLELNRLLLRYLRNLPGEPASGSAALILQGEASAMTAKLLTAMIAWVDGGVDRGTLREHLAQIL
jgi:AcrR family transcriptional regulator